MAVTCYVSGTNTLGSVYVDGVLRDSTLTVAKLSSDVGVAYPEVGGCHVITTGYYWAPAAVGGEEATVLSGRWSSEGNAA